MQNSKKKIKVLYVYPSLAIGGAEELRFLSLKNLNHKDRYEIKVCCIEEIGEIGERIRNLGIEVFCLNKPSKPSNLSVALSLVTYLLKNEFDIIQTSLFNANFHGRIAAFLARVPIIISEEHSEHYQYYNSFKFLPYIWSDRILSTFTDKIICCSINLMHSISQVENIPLSKFYPIVNTFNIDKLKITRSPSEVKKELGLDNNFIISNIASLSYRKGQDVLIRAFKSISRRFPSARLLLIGDEVYEFKQILLDLVDQLGLSGRILFLGKRGNIADYLNISDVFVLSSRFEGIPLALLEAMYMSVPAVSTNVGGVSEVIANNKNGLLVEPGNAESLASAVIELLDNKEKRREFIQEGKRTVSDKFNTGRYIESLENLYNELCKYKNGRIRRQI